MDLLETARLRLRRMEQGDVPALLRIMGCLLYTSDAADEL